MWKAGIKAAQSCQGNPERWVWLQFWDEENLLCFLNAVGTYEVGENVLHQRMQYGNDRPCNFTGAQWQYPVVVCDLANEDARIPEGGITGFSVGPPAFVLLLCVHFPRKDRPKC